MLTKNTWGDFDHHFSIDKPTNKPADFNSLARAVWQLVKSRANNIALYILSAGGSITCVWVRSRNCVYLVTWFCYQSIAKPGKKTATVSWPDPYDYGANRAHYHNFVFPNQQFWDELWEKTWYLCIVRLKSTLSGDWLAIPALCYHITSSCYMLVRQVISCGSDQGCHRKQQT